MPEFLAEIYSSRSDTSLGNVGEVTVLRAIFVPVDETWFWLVEAPSADAVRDAGRDAGVEMSRVVRAFSGPGAAGEETS